MTEQQLHIGSVLFEIGLPAGLLLAWHRVPNARKRIAVVLGAITPLLAAYLYVTATHSFVETAQDAWAFNAMWLMTFFPFLTCAIVGAALSLVSRPANLVARYFVGLSAPLLVVLLIWVGA
jgi:predicted permease